MIEQSVSLASNGVVKVPGYEQLVRFGYTKNRGVYLLHVDATGEWAGLAIRCFWHVPDGKDPSSSLVEDGYVAVPASVTAQPGNGCITFEGSDGTKTVTSADLRYRVSANSGTEDGTEPEPGTPAWQQLVDAVHADATAAEQAKTDAQTAAKQAGASAQKAGQALSDTIAAKEDALKAIDDKQTAATQAVDTARDKALQQVEASTKAAKTAASEAATSAGDADRSAQEAAGSLQELKDGIANGNFKGEPGNDGKSPVVTVTDIENGHRVSITDKDGTKTIDVLNGQAGKDGTQIDDTTVGPDAWSSKHIVDMLCPPIEETGNPAVCYPVAGYPLGCKVSWEPTQEGSGDPSPDNIRPISGRDAVKVERCGENLIKYPYSSSSASRNGLVFTSQQDGSIVVNGTATADTWFPFRWNIEKRLPINTPMTLSGCPAGGSSKSYYIGLYLGGKWFADTGNGNTDVKFTTREIASRVEVSIVKGTVCNNVTFYPKIEVGTTITPYSKYTGQTATLTLPRTIYGGTVDAVTGEGKETWKVLNILSASYIEGGSGGGWAQSEDSVPWCIYKSQPDSGAEKVLSNIFRSISGIVSTAVPYTIGASPSFIAFRLPRSAAATEDDVRNWLIANDAEIAFESKVQTPFTATGAQPIPALNGVNTVLTDADSATVTGRADPIKRITDLEDAVASMTTT